MSRASSLYRLQRIDTELDTRRAQLAEVNVKLAGSPAVQKAQTALAEAEAALAEARRKAKALADNSQSLADKIAEIESQLYGGKITNPRELKDLQADAESIKRRRSGVDDEQLAAMEAVEAAEARAAKAREALAAAEAARAEEQTNLLRDKGAIEALIAKAEGEREAALNGIDAADLAAYDALRPRKRGVAVALLEDGACTACGEAPSSSRIQAVRQGNDLVRCSNCDRILCAGQNAGFDTSVSDDDIISRW
jgi:predicted  nucleic acid-binding Zn-ribbon protein